MRRSLNISVVCVALAMVSTTSASAAVVNGYAGPLRASLHAGTHHPKVGHTWPFSVTASYGGHSARATAYYRFLYQGQVVSSQGVNGNFHFVFTGSYHDFMVFPARASGYPVTVQVVISEGGRTVYLNWAIQAIK